MRTKIFIILLLITGNCFGVTTVSKTVRSAAGDYSTLDAWEDDFGTCTQANYGAMAADGDLVSADLIAQADCAGFVDTAAVIILGWHATDSTRYIEAIGTDFPLDGVYDDTKYVLAKTDVKIITCSESNVRLKNLQFQVTQTGSNDPRGIYITGLDEGDSDIRIDSCIIKGVCSGNGSGYGIVITNAYATVSIFNTVVYGFISGEDIGFAGIFTSLAAASTIYHCTVFGCFDGIRRLTTQPTVVGCALFDNVDDFESTHTISYCATDEYAGGGDNGLDISGTWNTTCFTDPEASPPDVSVQDVDSPVHLASEITYDDDNNVPQVDIIDTARNTGVGEQTSIGAHELSVAAAAGQVIMIY